MALRPIDNVKTTTKKSKRQILAIGGIGSGKTTQFRTLKGRKFAYLFDPSARDALQDDDIDFLEFIPDVTDLDLAVKTLKKKDGVVVGDKALKKHDPQTYIEWEADFEERYTSGFFNDYDWVCWDSLTTFSEIVMDRVLFLSKRLGKHPEQDDYTAEMNMVKNIFRAATTLNGVYATAHTEMEREDVTKKIYGRVVLTGKNRTRIPLRFAHIFAFEAEAVGDKGQYEMFTVPTRVYPLCRTSLDLPAKLDVTLNRAASLVGQGLGKHIKV
jgi:hypothetical protein